VAAVLNDPSGWRGRQQQITTLQNKVTAIACMLTEFFTLSHRRPWSQWI
jgi:hypothetical protein